MLHVKEIREIIDAGKGDQAHQALDQLLALGPNNTEALKLRAALFEHEGRFTDEAKVWDRVAVIDREDPDAVNFLLRRQLEDREHFYFTDDIPGGGRRFMAYPRALVNNAAMGLIGCVVFLLSTRLSLNYPVVAEPPVMLGLFAFFVLLPWVMIMTVYLRCLRSLSVTPGGVTVRTRLKTQSFAWGDLEKVCLAHTSADGHPGLSLLFLPKDRTVRPIEIDLEQGSTAIRARSYLIREITRLAAEPTYIQREELGLGKSRVISF